MATKRQYMFLYFLFYMWMASTALKKGYYHGSVCCPCQRSGRSLALFRAEAESRCEHSVRCRQRRELEQSLFCRAGHFSPPWCGFYPLHKAGESVWNLLVTSLLLELLLCKLPLCKALPVSVQPGCLWSTPWLHPDRGHGSPDVLGHP